jgi:hypothetical protein
MCPKFDLVAELLGCWAAVKKKQATSQVWFPRRIGVSFAWERLVSWSLQSVMGSDVKYSQWSIDFARRRTKPPPSPVWVTSDEALYLRQICLGQMVSGRFWPQR